MEGQVSGVDALYQRFARANYDNLKAKELLPFPEFTTESEIQRDQILNQNVKGFVLANPWVYVQLCGFRLYQLFRVIPRHLGGPLATLAALITFGWILPVSLVGLGMSFKDRWRERSVLSGIIFYTVATATLTASGIPHRIPTDPYFILLAAFCVVKMLKLDLVTRNA